ncbi:MAG: hypothetical protein IKJ17_01085 [Clostridia bacterium]|nr:hypothetical protein [Clostridia bacterium]
MKRFLILLMVVSLFISSFVITANAANDALPKYIMHAGGTTPNGIVGSNSIQAMQNSYKKGQYWLELDFEWTSDGHLVCTHDWDAWYTRTYTGTDVPTLARFEKLRKTTYGFESPTLKSLISWLRCHPKAKIVTDVKSNNLKAIEIISKYPDLQDRFVIQIYSPEEYDKVASLGFKNIILTFYRIIPQNISLETVKNKKLLACTFPASDDYKAAMTAFINANIPIYVHTVNDKFEQQKWFDFGVTGIYSDSIPTK